MAIPKKGSRTSTIDDVKYRWVVSVHGDFVNLVVELAEKPGQRLLAYFECRDLYIRSGDGDWRFHSQQQSIKPRHIRRLILHALDQGWRPTEPSKPYTIKNAASVALTIDEAPINYLDIDPNARQLHLKEVARDYLDSVMCLWLCMDGEAHDKIMKADSSIDVSDDRTRQFGLTFCAYKDEPTLDGIPVVALQCNEFPEIIERYWWLYCG